MSVPYTFATANSPIPLSELDNNFSTALTLGTTPMVLGNTYSAISGLTSLAVTGNITTSGGYIIETDGGGYSALQANSVTVGNSTTGLYYNGSDAIGLQVNNVPVFGFFQSGNLLWGGYSISPPSGSSSTYLCNDGTWVNPTSSFLGASNTFTGANNIFTDTNGTYFGGSSTTNSMRIGYNGGAINWYNSITGNLYNSIYYTASSTALADQDYVVNFKTPGSSSGTAAYVFSGDGSASKTGGGSWGSTSDSRLKNNTTSLTGALDKITALNPVTYSWKIDTAEPTVGFLAQEVQKVIPNAVSSHVPTEVEKPFVKDRTLTIGWQNDMTAYLVGAIKELNTLVTEQAAEIASLKAKIGN